MERRFFMSQNEQQISLDYNTTISLLNVYFSEWSHRDQMMYAQMFKFFYAILVIILVPNLINYFQIDLHSLPNFTFRLIGLLLSFMFLYFNLGNALRFKAIGDTYQAIINELPEKYRRISIKQYKYSKLFTANLYFIVSNILFLSLFLLSLTLLIIE